MDKVRRFLSGSAREQAQGRAMAQRPTWECVLEIVEKLRGKKWETFWDRHGDWGRELALFLGRSACGLPLRRLG